MNTPPVLDLIQDGQVAVTILTAPDGSHDRAAKRVAEAIKSLFGTEPAIIAAAQTQPALPTPHVIALGCLADNPFIESLYVSWHTLVDRWYPGDGGWVIQTLLSPQRPGNHVMLLGGSNASGIETAADRFIARLKKYSGPQIPWCFEVQLGESHFPLPEDRIDVLGTSPSEIAIPESALPARSYVSGFRSASARDHLLRLGMYGPHADNFHLCRSSQFGLRYAYTGRIDDGERYRETLLSEVRTGVLRKLYHYKSLRVFQLWSTFGSSPLFSLQESTEITGAIKEYLGAESGLASSAEIEADGNDWNIFNRHTACDALNLWVGTDWLWRLTGETEWLEKRGEADAYFESQAGVDVPLTGLTEGYGSYLEVYLEWMVLSRPEQIATHPHLLVWAKRVMGLCTNTGDLVLGPQTDAARYPYNLMRKLAYLLNDGDYLYVAELRERRVQQGMDRVIQFTAGQAYAGDNVATIPDAIGLIITPPNERLRKWQAPSIDPHKGFDRIVARSGWRTDDDYLMLIGMRGGAKALPNVGSLATYERFGQRLITSDSVPLYPASANPWRHSTVCIDIGGLGPGMFAGAEILTNRKTDEGHLISFHLTSFGLCHWTRTVFWKPHAYLLVIDQVAVESEDEFTIGLNWRCGGRIKTVADNLATLDFESTDDLRFFVQVDQGLKLTSETNDYPALGMPPDTPPNRETMLHALAHQPAKSKAAKVATLLHATKESTRPRYHLETTIEGWRIIGPQETLDFQPLAKQGELDIVSQSASRIPTESSPIVPIATQGIPIQPCPVRWSFSLTSKVSTWSQSADATLAVGLVDGSVMIIDVEGNQTQIANCDSTITAITFYNDGLIVGCISGLILCLDLQGNVQWKHQCTFRSERTFWPYWFQSTPAVASLALGHDEKHERDVLVAGTGSTNLITLDAATGAPLADVISPYGLPDLIRTHRTDQGELRFLVGHSWLTCCSTVRAWSALAHEELRYEKSLTPKGRSEDGWDSCGVVDFQISPLIKDQPDRVIVLRHGAVNQITAYDEATAEPLWDATLGGPPVALAVIPAKSADQVCCYVADQFGNLVGFDALGKPAFTTRLDSSLQGMKAGPNGRLVAWSANKLHLIKNGCLSDSYSISGKPLGLIETESGSGFLSSDSSHLHFQRIT